MATVMAIANHKGGVAKTTTAFQLAGVYAVEDKARVLLIDLDPQGTLTSSLHFRPEMIRASVADLLMGRNTNPQDLIHPTPIAGLFLIPATTELVTAEKQLARTQDGELALARALETVAQDFDVIVIDCPPALDLLNTNGLRAAHVVVVTVESSKPAVTKLPQFMSSLAAVSSDPHGRLEDWRIAITKHEGRTSHARHVKEFLESSYPGKVFAVPIPHSVRAKDSLAAGLPLFSYEPQSAAAEAYRSLAHALRPVHHV